MPDIDQHLCLGGEPIEHFAIEQFVAKVSILWSMKDRTRMPISISTFASAASL